MPLLLQAQYSVPPKSRQAQPTAPKNQCSLDSSPPDSSTPAKTPPPSTVSTKQSDDSTLTPLTNSTSQAAAAVPTDALSVTANLVAVNPSGPGYLTVYPCGFDRPLASALNYMPGVNNANEFTVPLGDNGDICIYTHAETDIVVDIYGYYIAGSGGTGTPGQDGADGADGQDGRRRGRRPRRCRRGADGQDAVSPARVIWVAESGGDFTSLSEAMASIPDDNTAATPYVIKIAPGTYTENSKRCNEKLC